MMQRLFLYVAGVMIAVSASPTVAHEQAAASAAAGNYRIAGRVVNIKTGEPVRRAVIAALAETSNHIVISGVTDTDGRFVLAGLPKGKYSLSASKRGYRTAFYDEHDEYNTAIVTGDDQDTEHLVFKLAPEAVLRGVITSDGGDPVEEASVMLFRRPPASAISERITEVQEVRSNDAGEYEFNGLAAGDYLLAVRAEPWYAMHGTPTRAASSVHSPLDVAYPITFYDSTTDESSATPIALTAGSQETADVTLHAVPALHLRVPAPKQQQGLISLPSVGQTVFGVQIPTQSAYFEEPQNGGTAEYSVAPGHYQLTLGHPPRVVDVDATSNVELDALSGTPTVSVAGKLQTVSGAPLPDAISLQLEAVDGAHPPQQTAARKGQFKFDGVPPGTWTLTADAQGKLLPVVSVSTGAASMAGNEIVVADRALNIAATVSLSQTRVQGFARKGGKGASGVMILLVPNQPSAYKSLLRRDQSDSDGSFALSDVPPGQYTLIAIEEGWKLDWRSRAAIARYLPGGVSVTITDHSGDLVSIPTPVPATSR